MFNWSWGLRAQTKFTSPEGPAFERAPIHELDLDGTFIRVKLPRQRTHLPSVERNTFGNVQLANLDFSTAELEGMLERGAPIISRKWSFYGPWFTGSMGSISFHAEIITPVKPAQGLNYFHPRALESCVADLLTFRYSHEYSLDQKKQDWFGPVNWHQQASIPFIAARFDVLNSAVKQRGPHSYLIIPLTKFHALKLYCEMSRPPVDPDLNPQPSLDEWIDPQPFLSLIDNIFNSVEVTLSPEARAAQQEALQGLSEADKQLVKDFPPLKWTKSDLVAS